MERKTQTGYLVLADISGYTSFVAKTEIEHAGMALSFLLETIVEKLDDLLTIAKLEGDAVFAYIEDGKLEDCKLLLGLIDQTYLAFRDKARALHSQATCPCRACQALPSLDLKFVLHHGDFVHPAGGGDPGFAGYRCQPDPPAVEERRLRIHGLEGVCSVHRSGSGTHAVRQG